MPSMPSMKEEYGLDADVIMMAWRPLLRPLLTMARVTPTFAAHAGDEAVGEGGGGKEDGEDGEVEMGEGEGGEGMEVEDGEHAGQDGEREEGEADGMYTHIFIMLVMCTVCVWTLCIPHVL